MTLDDLKRRTDSYRKEHGQSEVDRDELEAVEIDARRSICAELGDYFAKNYTIALVSGVGTVYNLAGSINVDLLWNQPGRATHADGTEVSILPFGCTARDLTYPRFQGVYWGVVESESNTAIITVWQGDGATPVDNGNLSIDFVSIKSLANWSQIHESALVAKCVELLGVQAEAAA